MAADVGVRGMLNWMNMLLICIIESFNRRFISHVLYNHIICSYMTSDYVTYELWPRLGNTNSNKYKWFLMNRCRYDIFIDFEKEERNINGRVYWIQTEWKQLDV